MRANLFIYSILHKIIKLVNCFFIISIFFFAKRPVRNGGGILLPSSHRTPIKLLERNHVRCCRLHLRYAFGLFVPLPQPVEPSSTPSKIHRKSDQTLLLCCMSSSYPAKVVRCIYGGVGGIRTPVQTVYSERLNDLSNSIYCI